MTAGQRCCLSLKAKTTQHVTARWVVFAFFLILFLVRTLWILKQFFIIAYVLGLVLVVNVVKFWSPLNYLLSPTTINTIESSSLTETDNNDEEKNAADDDHHQRRVSEFEVWFVSFRAVIVSLISTCFPWLDVPVFGPFLLLCFVGLTVFRLILTFHQCRAAAAVMHEDDNTNRGKNATVQIHLVPQSYSFYSARLPYSIAKIIPWNAIRAPPPYLNSVSATEWKTFLLDVEEVMVRKRQTGLVLAYICKLGALGSVAALAKEMIMMSSFSETYCDAQINHDKCDHYFRFWITQITLAPAVIYYISFLRWLWNFQKQDVSLLCEKVQHICKEFHLNHPRVFCQAKVLRFVVVVEVKLQDNNDNDKSTTSNDNNKTVAIPNPQTSATVPLLQNEVFVAVET